MTVLLVDDDLDMLEAVELALAGAGARVLAAPSSESALRFVDTLGLDALVYRGRAGPTVLASIRARKDDKRNLPAVALVASEEIPAVVGHIRAATARPSWTG